MQNLKIAKIIRGKSLKIREIVFLYLLRIAKIKQNNNHSMSVRFLIDFLKTQKKNNRISQKKTYDKHSFYLFLFFFESEHKIYNYNNQKNT